MIEFDGLFDVLFVGREKYAKVKINRVIRDSNGHILYFEGPNDVIYNWSNILIMRRSIK